MSAHAELVTTAQLAKIYQVTPKTVWQWYREGRIDAEVAEGKILRFDPDKVAAALKRRARQAAKPKGTPALA